MHRRREGASGPGWRRAFVAAAGTGALIVAGVVDGACWSLPARAATRSFSSEPARAIVAQARAAMAAAGSVSATGSGVSSVPGGGSATIDETDYAGPGSGSQVLRSVARHLPPGDVLPSAVVVDDGGALYAKGNEGFWVSSAGVPDTQAVLLVGKWVHIPSSSSAYGPVAADLTMASLVADLFDGATYHKGSVRTVDGVPVVPITYTNRGPDPGRATCDVAAGGKHLPVSWEIGGLRLRFGSWGKRKPVTSPQGAVELPSLAPNQPVEPASPGGTVVT